MAEEKLLYTRANYRPTSNTSAKTASPPVSNLKPTNNNLLPPAHILAKNRSDVTVFEKPTTGKLLYVRKPPVKEPTVDKKDVWGTQDDEEAVRRDTDRRRALAQQITDDEKHNQESPLIQKERERREQEANDRIRKTQVVYTHTDSAPNSRYTPDPKKLEEQRKIAEQKKLEEQTKLAEQKRIQQQRQYETQIKREEELRLKQQQQYEEELRLSEKTRQSQSSFTEPDDDVELRLMLIEQLETLTLELNDKKKFLETLQQESKEQSNEPSTIQDLLRTVNELEDKVKKSKQNNAELSQAVETMSEKLYAESEAVTAFKASIEEDQVKFQGLLERRQELSNLLQLKNEQLNATEEEHMIAFEALEQTQVPDEEPEPEPELEEEILMKKMLEEERLREEEDRLLLEEEERLLREEEDRLLREEEEKLIREEEERLNKEEQLKREEERLFREEEERQRPEEEEKRRAEEAEILKAKEESSQADYRSLLKKKRDAAPTPLPIKEEKKEEENTNDFRNLLKKRSVAVPPPTEEKKEETSSTQQVDFRHLLKSKKKT